MPLDIIEKLPLTGCGNARRFTIAINCEAEIVLM